MEIIEHSFTKPDSWEFQGADWSNPDPTDARYWYAVVLAIRERIEFSDDAFHYNSMNDAYSASVRKLSIAAADVSIGKHCPVDIYGAGNGWTSFLLDGYLGNIVQYLRKSIKEIAPCYVDRSKLKEALNLKLVDESTGTWKIYGTRDHTYMPYYSYAIFANKYEGLTEGVSCASFYFDEETRAKQSRFLVAVKKCIDDMLLVPVDQVSTVGMGIALSSAKENQEGYGRFDKIGLNTKSTYYGIYGSSGYPEKKRYSLSYVCKDELYAKKDAMKQRILKMKPTTAGKAVSDAIEFYKSSESDMKEAVPNPDPHGGSFDPLSGETWYEYPRTDRVVYYEREFVYDEERSPMSDDYYKAAFGEPPTGNKQIRVMIGDDWTYGKRSVSTVVTVTNDGTETFFWYEPRREGDPGDKEYDDGEEKIGPTFSAYMNGSYMEYECYAPAGFEKGTVAELYSFAYIRDSSADGVTTKRTTQFRFFVPEGSNISSTEMEVCDPVIFDADITGKFKITAGSRTKFPEDVISPVEDLYKSKNGYEASVWLFFNGANAFKFRAT